MQAPVANEGEDAVVVVFDLVGKSTKLEMVVNLRKRADLLAADRPTGEDACAAEFMRRFGLEHISEVAKVLR